MSYSEDELFETFIQTFEEDMDLILEQFYPTKDNIIKDIFDLKFEELELLLKDPELPYYILENPGETFPIIEEALAEVSKNIEMFPDSEDIHFSISELPNIYQRDVRELKEKDLGKYIAVKGIIRRTSERIPKPIIIHYECERCGGKKSIKQNKDDYKLKEPMECPSCGKSSNKTNFKVVIQKSKFQDFQEVKLTERQRDLRAGEQPRSKKAILWDPLVDLVNSGDEVTFNCIYQAKFKKNSSIPRTYLEVKSLEFSNKNFEEVTLTEDEEERVKELSKDPQIFEKITESICPAIKGLKEEKESIALQQFSGVRKTNRDNNFRGDIHILLAGDPETGKSQLLRRVSKIAPKGIIGSGRGASGVGLTASVSQEEIAGESHWVLDPGILPLADGGLAAIDEFDKMSDKDRDTIHGAMTQQQIQIDKANIHQTLNSRCPILAAANPEYGKFDKYDLDNPEKKLIEEIDLKPELFSRFDYIWIITRERKKEEHKELANHITSLHQDLGKKENDPSYESSTIKTPISTEELKNYIKKAKEIKPVLSDEARNKIEEFYLHLSDNSDNIGPRTLEALIRSSEASARLHFREKVTTEDAERAIHLKEIQLKRAKEIELLYTGYTQEERTYAREVKETIKILDRKYNGKGIPEENVIDAAVNNGYDKSEVMKEIEKLRRNGRIYTPSKGRIKINNL